MTRSSYISVARAAVDHHVQVLAWVGVAVVRVRRDDVAIAGPIPYAVVSVMPPYILGVCNRSDVNGDEVVTVMKVATIGCSCAVTEGDLVVRRWDTLAERAVPRARNGTTARMANTRSRVRPI